MYEENKGCHDGQPLYLGGVAYIVPTHIVDGLNQIADIVNEGFSVYA